MGWLPPGPHGMTVKLGCAGCHAYLRTLTRPTLKEMTMPLEMLAPPSAPMMTGAPRPEPDDIIDPEVPPGTLDTPIAEQPPHSPVEARATTPRPDTLPDGVMPLANGLCAYIRDKMHTFMMDEHKGLMQTLDATLVAMRKWVEIVGQQNEHAQYSLADALTKLQADGLTVIHPPYQAVLHVQTPAGYALALTITKSSSSALVEELGRLEGWLQGHGYGAPPRQAGQP